MSAKRVEQLLIEHASWLLAAYVLVPPLFKASLQPFVPIDLTVLLALPTTAAGLAWLAKSHSRLSGHQRRALGLWAGLALLVALGTLWAPDRPVALRSAAYWGVFAAVPLIAAFPSAETWPRVRQLLMAFIVAGSIVVLVGLWTLPTVGRETLDVLSANRLGVARAALFVPLIGIPLLAWRAPKMQWLAVATLAPLGFFIALATGSRGAPIAFVFTAATVLFATIAVSPRRRMAMAIAGTTLASTLVLFVAFSWLIPGSAIARFGLLIDAVDVASPMPLEPDNGASPGPMESPVQPEAPRGGESVAQRIDLYALAWRTFLDRPIVGSGTGGFEARAADTDGLDLYSYPHNLPLHVAADFGVLGLLVVGGLSGLAVLSWRPTTGAAVGLAVLLVFLSLNAMLSNSLYDNRPLWAVLLVLLALPAGARTSPMIAR